MTKPKSDISIIEQPANQITDSYDKYTQKHNRAEELYSSLANSPVVGIHIVQDNRFVFVNPKFQSIIGYTEEELLNTDPMSFIHPDDRKMVAENWVLMLKGERTTPYEFRAVCKGGEIIWAMGTITSIQYDGKRASLGNFMDITERKQTQEEAEVLVNEVQEINRRLEQSNRELEDFAYVASHDLQEPLRKISSFGEMLRESLADKIDEDEQENLSFVIDGAVRMQAMINDLLTYSRISTKAKPFQSIDPNSVIEDLKNFELATALSESNGTIHIPDPLPAIHGDPSQIHQLLQNLIANGMKFHKEDVPPVITISSHSTKNNLIHFEIQDNGIGINEEHFEQIFVMFKRLHSRDSYQGTGIGLSICKKIVERHGGQIGIKSSPGEGSTFWFTLPRFGQQNHKGGDITSE